MRVRYAWLLAGLMLAAAGGAGATEGQPETASAPEAAPAATAPQPAPQSTASAAQASPAPAAHNGREIYRRFREGLAEPACEPGASARWREHFAHAPRQLAARDSDVLPLFGYVVDALREAYLPTEFALIPFIESGYRPGARSASGPAGLWQFIAVTARNHNVPIRQGYDGRLSPVDSTTAAVRYLKTLHGMFAGDWRLAVMAYNAGEYRVLGALKRSGQRPADADIDKLPMPDITRAYVRKLHALSCLLEEAEDRDSWLQALDRPVPRLAPAALAPGSESLDAHARRTGADPGLLKRLNPAFQNGIAGAHRDRRVLSPATAGGQPAAAPRLAAVDRDADISDAVAYAPADLPMPARTHSVASGESAWTIARRYGIPLQTLLSRNALDGRSVLRPGTVLRIDAP